MTETRQADAVRIEMIRRHLLSRQNEREVFSVPFRGEKTKLTVIRVPVEDLRFNVNLGRLILDRLTVIQSDLVGEPGDPIVQADIEKRILELREISDLRRLIDRDGQLQPGVVTADGFVINGNRRLAVLRDLYRSSSEERFAYMDVAVLPEDAEAPELFLLEAGLQMTPESRVRYGPVTTAVQIRRGLQELNLEKGEVARAMSMNVSEIETYLARLDLMDEYLAFIGSPGKYGILEGDEGQGKYQHFIEVLLLRQQHGTAAYWPALQRHVFVLIQSGATFDDLRRLKTWKEPGVRFFAATVRELSPASQDGPVSDPALADLAQDLTALDSASGVSQVELPAPIAISDDQVAATTLAFTRTEEMLQNLKDATKPEVLIDQALRKLEAVNLPGAIISGAKEQQRVPTARLRESLGKVRDKTQQLLEQLDRISPP